MVAYVIADVDVTDPVEYEAYKQLVTSSIAAYGGRYIARAGSIEVIEGGWTPKRLVILQFDQIEQMKAWLASPEYSAAKQVGQHTAIINLVTIEGLDM